MVVGGHKDGQGTAIHDFNEQFVSQATNYLNLLLRLYARLFVTLLLLLAMSNIICIIQIGYFPRTSVSVLGSMPTSPPAASPSPSLANPSLSAGCSMLSPVKVDQGPLQNPGDYYCSVKKSPTWKAKS